MKPTIVILFLGLLASFIMADCQIVDSLRCELIDWLDAPTNYNFVHDTGGGGYYYTGTHRWDLAMGDSFLVWLPGSDKLLLVDAYDLSCIDTVYSRTSFSYNIVGAMISDTTVYITAGSYATTFFLQADTLKYLDYIVTPWADYCYAVVEDSFLYTCNFGSMEDDITCINVADPEAIEIYRTNDDGRGRCGLEIIDGFAFTAGGVGTVIGTYPDEIYRPYWYIGCIDMINSDSSLADTSYHFDNRQLGDIAANDEYVFFVNSAMTDGPYCTISQSNFYVFGTDTSYAFDVRWYGQGVFGVDVIAEGLVAVGFEHGLTILNISNLSDIHEVAYYIDCDSVMDFTHFALKENRLYAMGHLDEGGVSTGTVRLWVFALADSVINDLVIDENRLPEEIRFWNYPNPFNSTVKFTMDFTPEQIEIYDINGRLVDTIPTGGYKTLPYEVIWQPESLCSGVYFARVKTGDRYITSKLVYLA